MGRRPAASFARRPGAKPRGLLRRLLDLALAGTIVLLLVVVASRLERVALQRLSGEVIVSDGDSLTLQGRRIRLRGIDAPEYDQTCDRAGVTYPCGKRSRNALAELVGAGPVECEGWELDRYRRLLATCAANGIELNRRLVEQGWAVAYGDYADAEARARDKKLGLWAGRFERPRDWRVSHGAMAESEHNLLETVVDWLRAIFGFS